MNDILFEEIWSLIVENFKGKGSFDWIMKVVGGYIFVLRENRINVY